MNYPNLKPLFQTEKFKSNLNTIPTDPRHLKWKSVFLKIFIINTSTGTELY